MHTCTVPARPELASWLAGIGPAVPGRSYANWQCPSISDGKPCLVPGASHCTWNYTLRSVLHMHTSGADLGDCYGHGIFRSDR